MNKTCPAEIPVVEGSDEHPDCDTALHPTGVSEADAGCGMRNFDSCIS